MCEKEDMQTARLWANRAEEMRVIAAGMESKSARDTLTVVADNWESMAAQKLRPILQARGIRI